MIAVALVIGTPFFIVFGALSDRIGRKPIMLAGFLIGALAYFPIFPGPDAFRQPALEQALATAPVTVVADPAPARSAETHQYGEVHSSCDIAKSTLVTKWSTITTKPARPAASRRSRSAIPHRLVRGAAFRPIQAKAQTTASRPRSAMPSRRTAIRPRPTRPRSIP